MIVAALAASCTLLGSRDVIQCQTDRDCIASTRPICRDNLCVAGAITGTDGSTVEAGTEASAPACTQNEDCSQADNTPKVCADNVCRPIRSERCPVILPNNESTTNNTVVLGFYLDSITNSPQVKAVETALGDANSVLGQRLMAVFCTKSQDKRSTVRTDVVDHLASLHLPTIIGDFESSELRDLAPVARDKKIGIWSTLASSSQVRGLDSGDLLRFFVEDLTNLDWQAALDAAAARSGVPTPSVALAVNDSVEAIELATALTGGPKQLMLGGSPVSPTRVDIKGNYDNVGVDYQAAVVQVTSSAPHILIAIGGKELATAFLPSVHQISGSVKPVYVVPPRVRRDLIDWNKIAPPGTSFRPRLVGVDYGGAKIDHDSFVERYKRVYASDEEIALFDHLYDATLVATFSAAIARAKQPAPKGPVTAEQLRDALKVIDTADTGAPLIGIRTLGEAVGPINVGSPIRYLGSTGPFKLDATGKGRVMGTRFFCYQPVGQTPSNWSYYVESASVNTSPPCRQP